MGGLSESEQSSKDDGLSIRITVACEPEVSHRRAEQIARSIQRYAEARPGVDHVYEREVYNLNDLESGDG